MNWTEDQKKAYQQAVLHQALKYQEMGLAVFPLEFASKRPFFEKLPLIGEKRKWEPFGEKRADEQQIRDWFSSDLCNIAVVQGAVSGNLVVMDFDEEPVGIPLAEYMMGETLETLAEKTMMVRTKKGAHVYLRTDAPVEYEKFDKLKLPVLMEIRADVHYVVAPPSIHPDSGQPYAFIGSGDQIMVLRTEQYKKWRSDLSQKLDEWPYVREILPYWKAPLPGKPETGGRQNLCLGVAAFFRKILEWPQERAEQIIRNICLITRDEEERQRINAVQSTYHKDDLDTIGTQRWLGEDLFNVLKGIPRPDKPKKRGKGKPKIERTEDVEAVIEAGLYDPDNGPAYDQFVHAVDICASKRNEKMLWALARAARFIGESAMARHAAAEALLINNHFITEADLAKPEIYWYDATAGIYRTNGRHQIAALVDAQVPDCSTDLKQNVVEKIMGKTRKPIQELKPPKWLICLQNGILNIENGQLEAYSPDHFFLSRFNVKYDADAKCPLFRKFLTEVLLPEDIPTMEEAIGYLLEKGMPFHVMFFLLGEGRNGKGVLMYVLQQFVGLDGFSAKGLEGLASPLGFDRAYLHGKIANFSGEVTDKPLRHVGMLKQLSGGDMVDGDRKFLSSVKWMNEAKLWFSMNIPPFTREITRAWWARIIIFEFPNIFMPGAPQTIPNLQEQLMTEQELSGILNLALDGRQRLMKRGWFSYTKTMENVEDLWLTAADTVHGWLGEMCEEDREYSQELTKDDLYESYSVYCKKKKLASQARNMFFERLKQLCPWIRERRVRAGTERVSVITGLRAEGLNALIRDERQQQLPMSQPVIGVIETNPDRLLATPSGQGGQGYSPLYPHEEENEEKRSNNGNNDTYVKGVQTTPTTPTKPPNLDHLAPPVRVQIASPKSISIKPKTESVIVESAEELQKALLDLQAKVTPQSLEHEFLILQWALEVATKNISAGDRVGAYLLRAEGMRKFTDQANSVARIVDTFYFEIESIAKRIVARKKSLQAAS